MKKLLATMLLPFIVFLTASTMVYASGQAAKNTQVLFVMLSKEASIRATDKPGFFALTLKGVNPNVIYFSNRPNRMSGQLATAKFVTQWSKKGVFSTVAPNAMLEAVKLNVKTDKLQNKMSSYAVVLTHPVYSSQNQNELSFEIKPLSKNNTSLPSLTESDYVAIFIDDVCLSCIGG